MTVVAIRAALASAVVAAFLALGVGRGDGAAAGCPCLPDLAIQQVCRVGGVVDADGEMWSFAVRVRVANVGNDPTGSSIRAYLKDLDNTAYFSGAGPVISLVVLHPGDRTTLYLTPNLQHFPAKHTAQVRVTTNKSPGNIEMDESSLANNAVTFTLNGLAAC